MAIKEIFSNPTVKNVIFQVRYPNLFYIDDKIGEFQLRIIERFSESKLIFRRQLFLADIGPEFKPEDIKVDETASGMKVWQFKSDTHYTLNVTADSLSISTEHHKSYNSPDTERFRDVIKLVIDAFLAVMGLPYFTRIGLRYIDDCPLPSLTNESIESHYNSSFPAMRFDLSETNEYSSVVTRNRGNRSLRYRETLKITEEGNSLILDFDGFTSKEKTENYLIVTDELHELISDEFEKALKYPVLEIMRGGQ